MEDLVNMGIISIIPAVLAIVLSFATKNTIAALAIACFTGTTLVGVASGTPIVETLLLGFPTLLKENLGTTSFSWVMLLNTFYRHPGGLLPKDRRHSGLLPVGPRQEAQP